MAEDPGLNVLVLGGSGATGRCLVRQLLAFDRVASVTNIGRREYDCFPTLDKVVQVVVADMSDMSQVDLALPTYELAFCTIGTTRSDAGSDEAFRLVDYTYTTQFINLCQQKNVTAFHLMSSVGADHSSWFLYPRTKGEVEQYVAKMQFHYSAAYRAPLLDRGAEARTGEKMGSFFLTTMTVEQVAKSMINHALTTYADAGKKGHENLSAGKMQKLCNTKI